MADKAVIDELWKLLRPFIKEHPLKKDTVLEEDVEMLISLATAFQVETELLAHVQDYPDAVFWDYLAMMHEDIPEGQLVPPGQEDILNDDGEDD